MAAITTASGCKTALVVEDSPVQLLALEHLLQEQGLQVLRARDGRVGVAMAERYLPDVIVLDVQLPELNGLEVCRQLKENPRTTGIPVIVLTAHGERETRRQSIYLGAVDFIFKDDFSGVVLTETLRQLHLV